MISPGIILIDKPIGPSSAMVVASARKILNERKIGHAGTLDPYASGLLVLLVGSATKLSDYIMHGRKIYTGTICFGATSTTDDREGELDKSNFFPDIESVRNRARLFHGVMEQVPPNFSAVKIDGIRAYKKARKKQTLTISARKIEIYSFQIVEPHFNDDGTVHSISFSLDCSKGTYVRSIARDIGHGLGCGGYLGSLRREVSRPFSVDQAVTLDELTVDSILPWYVGLNRHSIPLSISELEGFRHGRRDILSKVVQAHALNSHHEDQVLLSTEDTQTPVGFLVRKEREWKFGSLFL